MSKTKKTASKLVVSNNRVYTLPSKLVKKIDLLLDSEKEVEYVESLEALKEKYIPILHLHNTFVYPESIEDSLNTYNKATEQGECGWRIASAIEFLESKGFEVAKPINDYSDIIL